MSEHASLFALERHRMGEADDRTTSHVESCGQCADRLKAMEADDRAFMIAKPDLRSIGVRPKRKLYFPLLALAAGLLIAVAIAPPKERIKGASHVELLVRREGKTFPYERELGLRRGDTLLFRYTSARRHMLLAGIEDSGEVSIFVPDAQLEPGQNKVAPQGIELDDHRGLERVIVLLSDRPLDPNAVARALEAQQDPLAEPRFDDDADQASWVILKESP